MTSSASMGSRCLPSGLERRRDCGPLAPGGRPTCRSFSAPPARGAVDRECVPERQSNDERQLPIYQRDRSLRKPQSRSASAGQFVAGHLIQRSQLQPVRKAHERPSGGVGRATRAVGRPPATFSRTRPLSYFEQTINSASVRVILLKKAEAPLGRVNPRPKSARGD
jgi:hypothetical protein